MRRYAIRYFRLRNLLLIKKLVKKMKELSFKEWLLKYFAIDYDNVQVTEQTIEIWKEAYQEYLVLSEREVKP